MVHQGRRERILPNLCLCQGQGWAQSVFGSSAPSPWPNTLWALYSDTALPFGPVAAWGQGWSHPLSMPWTQQRLSPGTGSLSVD